MAHRAVNDEVDRGVEKRQKILNVAEFIVNVGPEVNVKDAHRDGEDALRKLSEKEYSENGEK